MTLPEDLRLAHVVAIALLFVLWFGYTPFLRIVFKGSLNDRLTRIRAFWLVDALDRGQGPADAILLGHIVNSITFFGSATMLVLAGTATLVTGASTSHDTVALLYSHAPPSLRLYVFFLLVLNGTLAISFFAFIYALRKLIYVIALVAAIPDRPEQAAQAVARDAMALAASKVLSNALSTFNLGIRGYYYFVAAIGLFVSPWLCMALSLTLSGLLVHRQVGAATAREIEAYVAASDAYRKGIDTERGTT